MEFKKNTIYHIFNQGNNRGTVFFTHYYYMFFKYKMEVHLLPFGDLIAYCLMPNHFHWLFKTHNLDDEEAIEIEGIKPLSKLNRSIGTLLSSYTKSVNIREDRTGSIFRQKTKAKFGFTLLEEEDDNELAGLEKHLNRNYAITCIEYIHQNPVKANLVDKAEDWPYSSAWLYAKPGRDAFDICNLELGRDLVGRAGLVRPA